MSEDARIAALTQAAEWLQRWENTAADVGVACEPDGVQEGLRLVKVLLSLLGESERELADLKMKLGESAQQLQAKEAEIISQVADHWFVQGGQAQFGNLHPGYSNNADGVVAEILARVRSKIGDLERALATERTARLQEVEHWVTRYNELEAWRIQQSKQLADARTTIHALQAQLADLTAPVTGGPNAEE